MFHAFCHRIGDGLKGAKLQRSVTAEVGQLRMQRQQKNWGGASVLLVKFHRFSVCFLFVYLVVCVFSSFFF